ncbi:helix-turn-helix transcriptional regulator (plasmid) [Acinetobacter sp. NCu2D-2]|uniref:helix-turn-helix transcriptional regulator n=1 Tax=Acinetobacter sp. NCu2D-2 TaxID=1608473 RepID=UPI0007CDF0BF|nr:LuxR C-terminal-related transcriptional regulator [Acinetobacter sp. NCu2D-2]ANF83447.1 helix-turn-helix transcriptional regulator [Acinetobacter sp. NCu2D-2]
MSNHQFLSEFGHNFIEQVQRVLNIDGCLMYSVDNAESANHYYEINIPKKSVNEYQKSCFENDPVSFKRFYNNSNNNVEILSQYECDDSYNHFMQRWNIQDTAEIFFRKRNGEPSFGLSFVRNIGQNNFVEYERKILQSFYFLSEKLFHEHTDIVDKEYLSSSYNLTKKEIAVLEQLLSSINNTTIANNLNCSLATIKTHIQHIYQKVNVANRQELLCKFLR